MPEQPLRGQAKTPCHVGESTFSGGCWLPILNQKPPCLPGFYFQGDTCYVPVHRSTNTSPQGPSSPNPE
jgi:hypothetical protein